MAKSSNKEAQPVVKTQDPSSLGRVGVIALLGFVVGVAWPRLAGVSLVPEAPVEEEGPSGEEDADTPSTPPPETEVIELAPEDRLAIGPAQITSCYDAEGKKGDKCDEPDVDSLVHPHMIALLGCPAATGVFGTLSLGFKMDFQKSKVLEPTSGRSTDLPETTTKELLRCAEKEFSGVAFRESKPKYAQYQVYYSLEFKPPEVAAQEKTAVTAASGQATVQWHSAQIRKEPEREGEVQARLLAGARVVVTGRMGEWYRVKYDAKGREGWIHGAALGLK